MSRVLDAIAAHAIKTPTAVALSGRARSYTYAELRAAVGDVASRLRAAAAAMRPGAPVAVCLENGPAWVIIDLALVSLGWPSLPIPGFFTAAQTAHAMADSGAGLRIAADGSSRIEVGGDLLGVSVVDGPTVSLPTGVAKITYTSGSTGQPKGVCLSQVQMEAVAGSLVSVIGADYAGRHLPLLPLAILLENVAGLYPILLAGGEYRVLSPDDLGLAEPFRPDLGKLMASVAASGATSLILVPELLRALLMSMAFTGATFPLLKLVAVGGAKVAPQLLERAAALGLPVFEGYGLSECASVVALNTPAASRRGSVGRPLPHVQVGVDEDGEIRIGNRPFLGYAGGGRAPDVLPTGDLGRLDDAGFLHIEGRKANTIINAFGRNIAPEWVESELLSQPEIRQAIVFGEAEPSLSALIVPIASGLDPAAVAAAIDRANQALPEYAQVKAWTIRDPFDAAAGELTGNGRPRRAAILARLPAHLDAQP